MKSRSENAMTRAGGRGWEALGRGAVPLRRFLSSKTNLLSSEGRRGGPLRYHSEVSAEDNSKRHGPLFVAFVKQLPGDRAPGPDGFPNFFFRQFACTNSPVWEVPPQQ